jgi:hypothetical protein
MKQSFKNINLSFKQALKDIGYFLKWMAIYILSRVLSAILVTIGIPYGIVKAFMGRQIGVALRIAGDKFKVLATTVDKSGNVSCKELWTDTLLKRNTVTKYPFGDLTETISGVIGINHELKKTSKTGEWVARTLDNLDKGHVEKAALDEKPR